MKNNAHDLVHGELEGKTPEEITTWQKEVLVPRAIKEKGKCGDNDECCRRMFALEAECFKISQEIKTKIFNEEI